MHEPVVRVIGLAVCVLAVLLAAWLAVLVDDTAQRLAAGALGVGFAVAGAGFWLYSGPLLLVGVLATAGSYCILLGENRRREVPADD